MGVATGASVITMRAMLLADLETGGMHARGGDQNGSATEPVPVRIVAVGRGQG
jgi:hypothetical protein